MTETITYITIWNATPIEGDEDWEDEDVENA